MTIINPRDMTRHYTLWGVSLALVVVLAGVMYAAQPAALVSNLPEFIKLTLAVLATLLGLLALSFKFVFAHELVSWVLLESVAVLGTIGIGLFGYHDAWLIYYAAAFAGLFLLGPYLHFD